MPPDPASPAPDPSPDVAPPDGDTAATADAPAPRRLGEGIDEPRIPRGCHPLVFGVVMATVQFAITVYFMRSC